MPSYEEIVAMTVAALQSGHQRPPIKSDNDRRPPSKDKPSKCWFYKDCWECGKNGHKRPDCPEYQALLAKNGGKRPKGHKGAFDKARDEFRRKHGGRSRTPSREREDKKEKRDKAIKQLRELSDSESDSDSEADTDIKTLKCSDARTTVFALKTRSCSSTESFHREDVPELSEDLALFRSLNQMCQRVAWSARMWNSSIGRFAMNLDEARVYCERLPTALLSNSPGLKEVTMDSIPY